jgi:WD40 repeat protein
VWDLAGDRTDIDGDIPSNVQAQFGLGSVQAMALSQDERWLYAVQDQRILVWDLLTADARPTPTVLLDELPVDRVEALAVNPLRSALAVGGMDGSLLLWSISASGELSEVARSALDIPVPVTSLVFTGDGRWLAAASREQTDGALWLWSIENPKDRPLTATGSPARTLGLIPSANGQWLAALLAGDSIDLWSLANLTALGSLEEPVALPGSTAAFHPDGSQMAVNSRGTLVLYDLDKAGDIQTLSGIELSRDGVDDALLHYEGQGHKLLGVVQNEAGFQLRTWNLDATRLYTYTDLPVGIENSPQHLHISENSHWTVVAGDDGPYQLWPNSSDSAAFRQILSIGLGRPVGISPNGRWLVTLDADVRSYLVWGGTLHLWRIDMAELIDLACATVGRNLSPLEWQQYFGRLPYRQTCPQLPSHPEVRQ